MKRREFLKAATISTAGLSTVAMAKTDTFIVTPDLTEKLTDAERAELTEEEADFVDFILAHEHDIQSFCPPILHKTDDPAVNYLIDAINFLGREGWDEFEKQMNQGGHAEIQIPNFDRFLAERQA